MMKLIHDYLDIQLTKKALIKEGNPQIWFNATLTLDCQEIDAKQYFTTMVGSTFLSDLLFFVDKNNNRKDNGNKRSFVDKLS